MDLEIGHLTESERILSYHDVFALEASELGTTDVTKHTRNHPLMRQPPRRMPFALRGQVDKLVGDVLAQQVIVRSDSLWASLVILVRKKNGGMWFCVRLNGVMKLV